MTELKSGDSRTYTQAQANFEDRIAADPQFRELLAKQEAVDRAVQLHNLLSYVYLKTKTDGVDFNQGVAWFLTTGEGQGFGEKEVGDMAAVVIREQEKGFDYEN